MRYINPRLTLTLTLRTSFVQFYLSVRSHKLNLIRVSPLYGVTRGGPPPSDATDCDTEISYLLWSRGTKYLIAIMFASNGVTVRMFFSFDVHVL